MKTIIIKLWMFTALLCASINAFAYDFEVDGICYDVTNTTKFTCGVSGILEQKCGKNITIPEHVSYLGKNLTVTQILDTAFEKTAIENISLPSTCVSIGDGAFYHCTKLSAIDIPQSITEIGSSAFYDCDNLTSVNISSLKDWCKIYFYNTSANPLSNYKAQLLLNGELVSKLSPDDSITRINSYAFAEYQYLTEVDLTNVQSIGYDSFYGCTNLKKLRIGQGLTEVPASAFAKCPNLTDLYIADSDSKLVCYGSYYISDSHSDGTFKDCNLKEVYIGRDLESYHDYSDGAIFEQQDIDSVTIGPKVNLINPSYFNGSKDKSSNYRYKVNNIKKLTILPSKTPLRCVFSIKSNSCYSGSPFCFINPNTIILGRNLEHGDYSIDTFFNKCTDLNYFEIGENVTDISNMHLNVCNNLSNIVVKSSTPPTCRYQEFTKNTYLHCLLKVPKESLNAYKSDKVWANFWNIEGCDFSGIENIESNNSSMSVIAENGNIKVLNKGDRNIVRVYSIQGMIIAETSENVVQNLPKGLYIVTVGTKSFKVILR